MICCQHLSCNWVRYLKCICKSSQRNLIVAWFNLATSQILIKAESSITSTPRKPHEKQKTYAEFSRLAHNWPYTRSSFFFFLRFPCENRLFDRPETRPQQNMAEPCGCLYERVLMEFLASNLQIYTHSCVDVFICMNIICVHIYLFIYIYIYIYVYIYMLCVYALHTITDCMFIYMHIYKQYCIYLHT